MKNLTSATISLNEQIQLSNELISSIKQEIRKIKSKQKENSHSYEWVGTLEHVNQNLNEIKEFLKNE